MGACHRALEVMPLYFSRTTLIYSFVLVHSNGVWRPQVLGGLGVHAVERAVAVSRVAGGALSRHPRHQRHQRARRPRAPRAPQLDRRLLRAAGLFVVSQLVILT